MGGVFWHISDLTDNAIIDNRLPDQLILNDFEGQIALDGAAYGGYPGQFVVHGTIDAFNQRPEPVPEPGTMLLVCAGIVFLSCFRRKHGRVSRVEA